MIIILCLFFGLIFLGAPIVFALGVSATVALWADSVPLSIVAQRMYAGLDSFTLMAIPFFVFAGLLMERGGIARRIVDFASALVGWIRGSLLLVSVLTGTGLSAISGSGSADTAATATILLPEMKRRRYKIDFSAALIAAAGSLGPVIPPSIMMVVFANVANLSVGDMFLGGILPGLMMGAGLLVVGYLHARANGGPYDEVVAFSFRNLVEAAVKAIPAFVMPFIIVGGIVGGIFTATEAAAVAVACCLLIGRYVYRELEWSHLPEVTMRAMKISATVMMIIATANIFSWMIARENVPGALVDMLVQISEDPLVFLLLLNIGLLIVGMFMEGISAILILVPVLMPVAARYGIDPLHLGVVATINLSIGMITPPYGITLFVASTIAQRPASKIAGQIKYPLIAMLLVLVLVTYVPWFITALPNAFK